MIKENLKEELLPLLAVIRSKKQDRISYYNAWDKLYRIIELCPDESLAILEEYDPVYYRQHFLGYFSLYLEDKSVQEQFRYMPPLLNYISCYPAFRVQLIRQVLHCKNAADDCSIFRVGFSYRGRPVELEVHAYLSSMNIKTVRSHPGIVYSSSHVPFFMNPFENGYMMTNGRLRMRGVEALLNLIRKTLKIIDIIKDHPAEMLGVYSVFYHGLLSSKEKPAFGKLDPWNVMWDSKIYLRNFNNYISEKYGTDEDFSVATLTVFQQVIMQNPELFSNMDN